MLRFKQMGTIAEQLKRKLNNRPKRLSTRGKTAFVLAHPDDETITGAGYLARLGTLAKLRAIRHLVSLTNQLLGILPRQYVRAKFSWVATPVAYYASLGEKGNHNGVRPEEKLEKIRSEELQQVTKILGMRAEIDSLGDGKLKEGEEQLEEKILYYLEKEQPDRVITFPSSGLTGHPDHIAISRAATRAVERYNQKSSQPIELYYRVIDSKEKGITGPYILHDPLSITHKRRVFPFRRKIRQVIEAHRTQVPEMGTIYLAFKKYAKKPQSPPHYKGETAKIWKTETYHRVD